MIIPGVQKPHCSPCSSQKPFCSGCSWPSGARPSIVVIVEPSACTAKIVHDFALRPSTRTVQAPHWRGVAADVRAGQAQLFAEEVDEQDARVDLSPCVPCR